MTEPTPVFDAGNADAVRTRRKELKRVVLQDEQTLRQMLSRPEARKLFWDFLGSCGIFQQECLSMEQMYFRAGERNAGLRLFAMVPEDLKTQMAQEAKESADA